MGEKTEACDVSAVRADLLLKMGEGAKAYPAQLELRFPRILARIAEQWGTPELDAYLDGLMLTERHDRQGFPPEVAMEIFRLAAVHGALNPESKRMASGWAAVDDATLETRAKDKKSLGAD